MSTIVKNGDDSAYRLETELSVSKEQADALYNVVERENDTELVRTEIVQQLADAGYNQDVIDSYSNDPVFVSAVADIYHSVKTQTVDPRLFRTVQKYLLDAGIIAFVEPSEQNDYPTYDDNNHEDELPPLRDDMHDTIID